MTHVYAVDAAGLRARLMVHKYDIEMLSGRGKRQSPKNTLATVSGTGLQRSRPKINRPEFAHARQGKQRPTREEQVSRRKQQGGCCRYEGGIQENSKYAIPATWSRTGEDARITAFVVDKAKSELIT